MKNLIGYNWKDASNGAIIEVINPATQELIDTVPNVTLEDVDEAVKVAKIEQKKWADTPMHKRGRILEKFVNLVEENAERLATLLMKEKGNPLQEARAENVNNRKLVS